MITKIRQNKLFSFTFSTELLKTKKNTKRLQNRRVFIYVCTLGMDQCQNFNFETIL